MSYLNIILEFVITSGGRSLARDAGRRVKVIFRQKFLGDSISVTLIKSYTFKKLMFKIPVGYDFTTSARYERQMTYNTFSLNTRPILSYLHQKFKNSIKDLPIFIKPGLFLQKSS